MSSSVKKNQELLYVLIYGGVTFFSMVFATVYYVFSHELRDYHMSLLWIPPLVVTVVFLVMFLLKHRLNFNTIWAINVGFCLIWIYFVLQGIYSMAKAGSEWLWIYPVVGGILLFAAVILEIVFSLKARKAKAKE